MNVRLARLFVSFSSGIVFAGSTRTSSVWTPFCPFADHAAVTVDLYAEDWSNLKGVMVQGTAELIERGPRFRKLRRLLYDKYPQYPEDAGLEEGDVIVEITPRHVFAWGLD